MLEFIPLPSPATKQAATSEYCCVICGKDVDPAISHMIILDAACGQIVDPKTSGTIGGYHFVGGGCLDKYNLRKYSVKP